MNVGFLNPEIFEVLPNARLSPTARAVFDVLTARQEPAGLVRITQKDLARRLNVQDPAISRAIGQLRDRGILHARHRQGLVLIHPLLAGYESLEHMLEYLKSPDIHIWPLRFPAGDIRPPRRGDARAGTDFDPDPDGGERATGPVARPSLRLVS